MLRIAQISDLHVRRSSDRNARDVDARIIECLHRVNAAGPDLVIATGDLTDTGSEEEYRRLRELMAELRDPYYLVPGNHDDPHAMRNVYEDRAHLFENDHASYAIDAGDVCLILLNSTKRGRPGGYMDNARLEWLERQLRGRSGVPTMVALHHPPFNAGVWPMDWLGFTNLREFERIVRAHRQIQRVVSGHVHCARAARWGGTFACTSPSVKPQHLLIGVGWRPPRFHFEPAGFLLHAFDGNRGVTHVHRIGGRIELLG